MRLVTDFEEILANIAFLENARRSDRSASRQTYLAFIKRGTCFLPYQAREGIAFAPSRFIGYRRNSFTKHQRNPTRDGRQTNPAISAILGDKPIENDLLEREYVVFCRSIGIEPTRTGRFGAPRKFWVPADISDRIETLAETDLFEDTELTVTERNQIIKARYGQGIFRSKLIAKWKRCCLTGTEILAILRASHIKPWSVSDNHERLDVWNGLLLSPNLDALFDVGLITFSNDGEIIRSKTITERQLLDLGWIPGAKLKVGRHHAPYLAYHRRFVFEGRRRTSACPNQDKRPNARTQL